MPIIRYSPLRDLEALQRQMNRLFDDIFVPTTDDGERLAFVPAVEISETEEALKIKLEVPGMEAKDLDVQVSKESVYISGERRQESHMEEGGLTKTEFRYGKFQRVIPLPSKVDNGNVQAEYKDGILLLTLPKAEEEKNKVVKVPLG